MPSGDRSKSVNVCAYSSPASTSHSTRICSDSEIFVFVLRARRRIVYVSCDPQTLGRDARALKAGGFRLVHALALDLMPQTFHVEVVATFEPESPGGAP